MTFESPNPRPQTSGDIDWKTLFISFEGRARRMHFGIGTLIIWGISIVLAFIPLVNFLGIILCWPSLALQVKRLHDMDKPGWLAAIPLAVGVVAGIVGGVAAFSSISANPQAFQSGDPTAVFAALGPLLGVFALAGLVGLGFFLWLVFAAGTVGPNRFGPDPKAQA